MAKSSGGLELDFFSMEEKELPSLPNFERRRSFRDIQGVISKINPDILKSVIANYYVSAPPKETQICDPILRLSCGFEDKNPDHETSTTPLTIFYNGTTVVFDVTPQKAKDILKVAEEGSADQSSESKNSYTKENLLEALNGDLPIARRKSLQRFLEKRTERLTMVSPYDRPTNYTYSGQSTCTKNY